MKGKPENEEKLKKELAKTRLELEHYKGFYMGVHTILNFIKENSTTITVKPKTKEKQIQYLMKKIESEEK